MVKVALVPGWMPLLTLPPPKVGLPFVLSIRTRSKLDVKFCEPAVALRS